MSERLSDNELPPADNFVLVTSAAQMLTGMITLLVTTAIVSGFDKDTLLRAVEVSFDYQTGKGETKQ